jgi:uncharacterized membrane protein YfcA
MTWILGLAGLLAGGFVKGAVGFGFPAIATPLLALASDVRTAVVVLLVPNIVMDGIQVVRRPGALVAARRHAPLVLAGVVGTVIGTQFLAWVSPRGLLASLGSVILVLVVVALARPAWQLPPGWEQPVAPLVGLAAGVLGGLTNVPGPPIPLYYQALRLSKTEFVRAVALTLLVLKIAQDRVPAAAFYRAVLLFLGAVSIAMLLRALRS